MLISSLILLNIVLTSYTFEFIFFIFDICSFKLNTFTLCN